MPVYLVTWNLNKEGAAYDKARQRFVGRLGGYQNAYDGKRLDTVCFISTPRPVDDIYNDLGQALDQNDRLVITRIEQGSFLGWLSADMAGWINARL